MFTKILKKIITWEFGLLALSLVLFLLNAKYVTYPDEFVNILGGMFINQGKLPYTQYFDHHLPFAWYFAALLLKLTFGSYVKFRLLFAFFNFGCLFFLGKWIKKNFAPLYNYFLVFLVIYPAMAVYFWFHLYLADSLAVLFFSISFWILLTQSLSKKQNTFILKVVALTNFAMIFSSLTFVYVGLVFYVWQIYLLKDSWKKISVQVLWMGVPYLVYLIYLLLTGSFQDFYFANMIYNTQHYITLPNYVKGARFNPLKFALTIIYNFSGNYFALLASITKVNLYLPIGVMAALGSFALLVLFLGNSFILGGLFFFTLVFSAPRSNIQVVNGTDYQGSLFLVLGLIASLVTIYLLNKKKTESILVTDLKRLTQLILVIFLIFTGVCFIKNSYEKYFQRYTQKMPSIYNFSYTAQFIDLLVDKGEYYWIGPYEPQEMFYVKNGQIPGKYPSLLPQFREDDFLKKDFIKQMENHPPKIVIYRQEASIFGTPSLEFGKFYLEWMKGKYTAMENIKGIETIKSPSSFNLRTDLYVRNESAGEVLKRLKENNYIR